MKIILPGESEHDALPTVPGPLAERGEFALPPISSQYRRVIEEVVAAGCRAAEGAVRNPMETAVIPPRRTPAPRYP